MKNLNMPVPQLWAEEIVWLSKVVAALPEQSNIVEIGTAQGGGFHLIANSRKNPKNISLHSYDPYPGIALRSLVKLHKNAFSHPIASSKGADVWRPKEQGAVDLLIIDGSHTLEAVHNDYTSWKKHLSRPSEIIFHDYDPIIRDGASHPGVKVFCDALLLSCSQIDSDKARSGRYILIHIDDPPSVSLSDLKISFKNWFTRAAIIASFHQSGHSSSEDALIRQFLSHSRLGIKRRKSTQGNERDSDFAFILSAATSVSAMHEVLLRRSENRAVVLKWLECLEMFMHAKSWNPSSNFLDPKKSAILKACDSCNSIGSISRLCADITILVCIIERLFGELKV
jgi:hypothetical protein